MKRDTIQTILNTLFPDPKVPLIHHDPYTLLIATLLSAQCTDAKVNTITPLLFKRASTPEQMIQLSIEEIASIIRPCGLYRNKAKAIWHLSQILLKKHKGKVPSSLKALEQLPGVGHKTASVVLCQAFKKPAFPVDTHIHRCAKRWHLSKGRTVEQTEKDLKKIFSKKDWSRIHLQIIYFARKYCPAKGHLVENCPICSLLGTDHDTGNKTDSTPSGSRSNSLRFKNSKRSHRPKS
jgi:endonuclease III